ncbi:MAG TPA: cyclase, partial [Acidobacteriaceae bacterium]
MDFVFAFLANPSNLPKLMLPWQDARIDEIELHPARHSERAHPMAAIAAGTGTRMTLSFRPTPLAPVRVSWEARIEDFHWNERFCDR